ncbi:Mycolic acid cyclopropane synthetase-domain-containing protein [Mycena albidolilacea]|uniref:Mycolic acid cyclopropane synthetase-domain-containing protein n=1 Tax=Mycena albidolilacea TaxID=1033008 RepID=A0AAD6ZFF5_9AGAR|nr:Mycolic acid cyclopropane synthetase-domain-containing protein [Mycena albidolilacea]
MDILRRGLVKGELLIEDQEGTHSFGTAQSCRAPVVLKVLNDNMWARICLSHDIGLSEAYMFGDFEVSTLQGLLDLWLDNRDGLTELMTVVSTAFARYSALAISTLGRQSLNMARWNVEVAYDVSNEFMSASPDNRCFLSEEMMYSCAIWGEEEGGPRGDLVSGPTEGDLEAAQRRKIHLILNKARISPGQRLLEIGSGWGAMALEAARLGCEIDTVTLSIEQKTLTEERARAAGFADQIRVHLCDYRNLPREFEHKFDAFVSCEMIEAVGVKHLGEYFNMLDWALKSDRATAVITATAQPEHRYQTFQPDDFGRHYHWPNCHLPSATSLAVAVQNTVPGKFVLYNVEDQGIHYPRTLREWGRRLDSKFKGEMVDHLQETYPELHDPLKLQAFVKRWRYMFAYAAVGYARAYTSLMCWTFTRPVRPDLVM